MLEKIAVSKLLGLAGLAQVAEIFANFLFLILLRVNLITPLQSWTYSDRIDLDLEP